MSRNMRRRLGLYADELKSGTPLRQEMRDYLVEALRRLANGEDANDVFNLSRGRGQTKRNEDYRRELAKIFHWMTCAMLPVEEGGYGWTASEAIDAVSSWSQGLSWKCKKTGEEFSGEQWPLSRSMTSEALTKAWYNEEYADLKKPSWSDSDYENPYL